MDPIEQLTEICKETTGCHLRLAPVANTNDWSIYIYKSKLLLQGSFKEVVQEAINEILAFRIDPLPDAPKNLKTKYRYLKNPNGKIVLPKKGVTVPNVSYKPKLQKKDSYTLKLEFSNELGYKNFTECFMALGGTNFKEQFNNWNQSK